MVLFRAFGWVLLALAVGAVVHDALNWWSDGGFRLLALGELWSRLDLASLDAVQRDLSGVWSRFLLPLLRVPALPAFVIGGVIFLWLGRRIGSRAEPSFLGGSRPPRKRRSRGLS